MLPKETTTAAAGFGGHLRKVPPHLRRLLPHHRLQHRLQGLRPRQAITSTIDANGHWRNSYKRRCNDICRSSRQQIKQKNSRFTICRIVGSGYNLSPSSERPPIIRINAKMVGPQRRRSQPYQKFQRFYNRRISFSDGDSLPPYGIID